MIRLEELTGHHNRKALDCGVPALNQWLRQTALQHQKKGLSRTLVATPADATAAAMFQERGYAGVDTSTILGFYCLAAGLVQLEDLPAELARRYPRQIPVTRLGRLAVEQSLQGQGLGQLLLVDAINRARGAAQIVGSAGIVVDAKDAPAAGFYRRYGFVPCGDRPLKLYLPLW